MALEKKSDFQRRLAKDLKNPDFKKEWESLELEYQIQATLLQARIDADMTQAELAKKNGVRQSNISRRTYYRYKAYYDGLHNIKGNR